MRKLLLVTGALVAVLAVIAFGRRRRRPSVITPSTSVELAASTASEDLVVFDAELVEVQRMGLSEVDPQPITQIAGEGIDLDTAPGVELLADEPPA